MNGHAPDIDVTTPAAEAVSQASEEAAAIRFQWERVTHGQMTKFRKMQGTDEAEGYFRDVLVPLLVPGLDDLPWLVVQAIMEERIPAELLALQDEKKRLRAALLPASETDVLPIPATKP